MLSNTIQFIMLHIVLCNGARILGVIPTPSYSHQVAFRPIWRELASRGHHVTVLTTDPMNDTSLSNVTEIDWSVAYTVYNKMFPLILQEWNCIKGFYIGAQMMSEIVDLELRHEYVQYIIHDSVESFDLVMIEFYYPAMFAFSTKFNCPFIGLMSFDATMRSHGAVGNPTHPGLYSEYLMPFLRPRNLYERIYSTAYSLFIKVYEYLVLDAIHENVMRKHFGDDMPSLEELYGQVDLIFTSTNPIFHNIRPSIPIVIQFGGSRNMNSAKPLSNVSHVFL